MTSIVELVCEFRMTSNFPQKGISKPTAYSYPAFLQFYGSRSVFCFLS